MCKNSDDGARWQANFFGCGLSWLLSSILLLTAAGCGRSSDSLDPTIALMKAQPSSLQSARVEQAELWKLVDRSTATSWALAGESAEPSLRVHFDDPIQLVAIKFYSEYATPPVLLNEVGQNLSVVAVESNNTGPQWHKLLLKNQDALSNLTLRFEDVAIAESVRELEFWTIADAPPVDLNATSALAIAFGTQTSPVADLALAENSELRLVGTSESNTRNPTCISTTVTLGRDTAQYRRAYLAFQASDLFRDFVVARTINGRASYGGHWLSGETAGDRFAQEIDPSVLREGLNELRFCLPAGSSTSVTLRDLRLVLVPELGNDLVADVRIEGGQQSSGAALLDHNAETVTSLEAGQSLHVDFERFVSPDVLRIEAAGLPKDLSVFCHALSGIVTNCPSWIAPRWMAKNMFSCWMAAVLPAEA